MTDGVAYLLRLKLLLDHENMPLPAGIVLNKKMWGDIKHAYPVAMLAGKYMHEREDGGCGVFAGFKIYREKK